MSVSQREAPTNLASLQARINHLARERGLRPRRLQRAVASTVVGQMLPDGVVKGGTAMKIRVGEADSRYTPDFDASRSRNVTVANRPRRIVLAFRVDAAERDVLHPEPGCISPQAPALPSRHR